MICANAAQIMIVDINCKYFGIFRYFIFVLLGITFYLKTRCRHLYVFQILTHFDAEFIPYSSNSISKTNLRTDYPEKKVFLAHTAQVRSRPPASGQKIF